MRYLIFSHFYAENATIGYFDTGLDFSQIIVILKQLYSP